MRGVLRRLAEKLSLQNVSGREEGASKTRRSIKGFQLEGRAGKTVVLTHKSRMGIHHFSINRAHQPRSFSPVGPTQSDILLSLQSGLSPAQTSSTVSNYTSIPISSTYNACFVALSQQCHMKGSCMQKGLVFNSRTIW